ncbi:MAG: hypothetical protein RJA22_1679 [Verrucomicrobiota bacterium]
MSAVNPLEKGRRPRLTRALGRLTAPGLAVAALVAALLPQAGLAAAPGNDLCSGAVMIPGQGPFPHYAAPVALAEATVTGQEAVLTNAAGFCQTVSRGVWYTFTPTTNAFYTLSTCSGATTLDDTVIALYTSSGGCSGPFTRLECNDDSCGPGGYQSSITRQLLKDTTYYLVIWNYDTAAPPAGQDAVQLVVNREYPPANDTCATAQPVFLDTRMTGSTILASNDYQLSGSACFAGVGQTPTPAAGRDVVYSFTAPAAGAYSVKVYNYSFESGFNLVVYAAAGCLGGTRPIPVTNCLAAANRNGASTAEEIPCLPLSAGQQVYLFVDDANATNRGCVFTLEVNRCLQESEPNNSLTNAGPCPCGIQGSTAPLGDGDFFALGFHPAGSRVFALVDGEAANLPDFDLRVTSTLNTLEFDNNDNDSLFAQSSANVAGTPLPLDQAFLRVSYSSGQAAEPYRLYAVVQPPAVHATPETEPNNSIAFANTGPRNYFSGTLAGPSPSVDADVFSFVADEGDLLLVGLDADPLRNNTPINAQLELLDTFGNPLLVVNDGNSVSQTNVPPAGLTATLPSSPAESFVYRCSEGTYYVRVGISPGASGATASGDYLLSISRNCRPGTPVAQPARFLSLVSPAGGTRQLQLQGTPGAVYRVEWSADLRSWTPFDAQVADAAGLMLSTDTAPASPARFYRAVAP